MEVHHLAQTVRKKWTHYFREFLLLFLALLCGFLAEHQREKQFIRSRVEDLQTDTANLSNLIRTLKETCPLT